MSMLEKQELPWWQNFGIGYKKLKQFISEHPEEEFVLWNGNRAQIKRIQFERYLDSKMNVI